MRHLLTWIGLALCLAAISLSRGISLTDAVLPVASASDGEWADATLWEREPVAATVSEPTTALNVVQPRPARTLTSSQGGKQFRSTTATVAITDHAHARSAKRMAHCMMHGGWSPSASCAIFIALRHIVR